MNPSAPLVTPASPSSLHDAELDDFVSLVLAGGEVTRNGLRNRVLNAECITFLREGNCLLGVGGLKRPSARHRAEVEVGAGVNLASEEFPFELGWVFILPSARGRKLSGQLCRPLVAAAGSSGIFATSREDRVGMHATLLNMGFKRAGGEWPSVENKGKLFLFRKNAP